MKEEIFKGAQLLGLALFLSKEKVLVAADLHLGFEEMLNSQGVLLPRINFQEIKKQFEEIFAKTGRLDKIVIAGDLKHEFGRISRQEWQEVLDMLGFLQENCQEVVLIQGNHDKILGPLADWKKLTVLKKGLPLRNGEIFVLHGHEIPEDSEAFKKAKILVIAHEHLVVSLRESARAEKFKCFLKGKWKKKQLIVLPSFLQATKGTDVLNDDLLSPFLQQDLSHFEAWLVEDKPYYFGKLGRLE